MSCLERRRGFEEVIGEVEEKRHGLQSTPCLLLWGEPEVYFHHGLPRLQETFPNAETVRIQGAGHFLFENARQQVNDELLRFFEGASRPAEKSHDRGSATPL